MDFNLMLLITGACGVVIGFGLAYFSNRNKATELNMLKGELAQVRDQLSAARREAELKQESLTRLEERADKMQSEFGAKSEEVARVNAEKSGLQEKIETYQKDLAQMQEQFRKDFENLANKIFDEKTEKFTKQNKLSLDQVLVPLKDRIIEFQKKVEDSHTERIKETTGLRSELKQLKEMSQKMTTEAENLTKALKNDSKAQGNWGEMILETILQGSGLARDREYFLQKSFTTDEGRRLQPD
ncbi:MAG TPA: DNA recombination protein RmuC, partial [Cryomorphaceae bacterium]|nr:DNA recombination protein RmuC [Cryomorphaceae bacterium]